MASQMPDFSTPRVNVIESDEGFSVEVLGQTGLQYTEGENHVRVDAEVLAGPSGLAIYSESLREMVGPKGNTTITPERRSKIIDNIRRAFRFSGFEIQVI